MYDVFGTAADERSSVATECELARKPVFSSRFAPQMVLFNSSKAQRLFSESGNGISVPSR